MFHESQQIGVYTLIRKLGQGGFGEVWLAENRNHSPSEKVAIKLPRNDQIDLQAVKDEIFNWTLSGKHKNILPIIECETFGNQIAIISEFAPDGSLQDLLKKYGSFSVTDAVEITIGILDGLAHLHNRKIIHRDLKPDNVLFQGRVPRLTDFGISRAMTIGSQSQTVSGTLAYMAPESFDGKRNAQTDIWAVGVILYQLLTGSLPFPQKEMIELVGALAMKEPEPLPNSIPLELQNIVSMALAKTPIIRYKKATEMRQDLQKVSGIFSSSETILSEQNIHQVAESISITESTVQVIKPNTILTTEKNSQADKSEPIIENLYLIPYREGDKWGFCDKNKNLIIDTKYKWVHSFSEDFAAVQLKDKYGFIDKTGRVVIPFKYAYISGFTEGFAEVKTEWGDAGYSFIDKTGKEITSRKYHSVKSFSEGLAIVIIDDKYGFIDKTGSEIVSPKYRNIKNFSEGLAAIRSNNWGIGLIEKIGLIDKIDGYYRFIDKTGKSVFPLKYDFASSFSEGLAFVKLKDKSSFIDKTGKETISLKYDWAYPFSEGLARVELNKKHGFINKKGREVIPLKYNYTNKYEIAKLYYELLPLSFSEGLAPVKLNGKWGYINKTGKEITAFKYDDAKSFFEGLAGVELNGKWGFIDKMGKEVISLKYQSVSSFSQGLSIVNNEYGCKKPTFYIGKDGTEYYEP